MLAVLKTEFCRRNFGLQHHRPESFCEAQWRWPRMIFVICRILMAGYTVFALSEYIVAVMSMSNRRHNVIVFLTTWTYLLETTYFILGAVIAILFFIRPALLRSSKLSCGNSGTVNVENPPDNGRLRRETNNGFVPDSQNSVGSQNKSAVNSDESQSTASIPMTPTHQITQNKKVGGGVEAGCMPWYLQMYWVVSNMIQAFALIVTLIYFGALYRPQPGEDIALHNINVHGINSVLIIIDVFVCARPVRLLHAIYPVFYGLAYMLFTLIYWSQDKQNNVLYSFVLDWNSPGITLAVVLGLCLVGIPLLQLLHFGLFKLRLFVYKKIYGDDYL